MSIIPSGTAQLPIVIKLLSCWARVFDKSMLWDSNKYDFAFPHCSLDFELSFAVHLSCCFGQKAVLAHICSRMLRLLRSSTWKIVSNIAWRLFFFEKEFFVGRHFLTPGSVIATFESLIAQVDMTNFVVGLFGTANESIGAENVFYQKRNFLPVIGSFKWPQQTSH